MTLLRPIALFWILLALPVALLYWRRLPVRTVQVGPVHLWKQVLTAIPPAPPWRRWRRQVSLGVQLFVILLLTAAMAEPLLHSPRTWLLLIDNASRGEDADSDAVKRRLVGAKRAASARVDLLASREQAAVVTTGDVLRVRCGLTNSRDQLQHAIDTIQPAAEQPDPPKAIDLAMRLAAGAADARVLVLTDDPTRFSKTAAREVEFAAIDEASTWDRWSRFVPRASPWSVLAVFALGLVATEWCCFQRRWTE